MIWILFSFLFKDNKKNATHLFSQYSSTTYAMISRKSHLENQTIKGIMYLQTKVLMCENVHPLQELLSIPKYIQKKNEKNNNKERSHSNTLSILK